MSLFLAQNCPVCDRPTDQTFCLDCQRQIYPDSHSAHLISNGSSQTDLRAAPALPVCALGLYSGSLKRAILAMKYGDRPDIAAPLGAALAQHWLAHSPVAMPSKGFAIAHSLCAVPIPLHADRQKSRGFNQAELIARSFCQVSDLPLLTHGLIRIQATRPQHELGLADRQQNLNQVFQVGPSLKKRWHSRSVSTRSLSKESHRASQPGKAPPAVLLIDDIYTTGATAQSAATTLRDAGISVAGIVAVAQAAL